MSCQQMCLIRTVPKLRSTNTVLTSYSNETMKPLGLALLRVRHRGQTFYTEFYIVEPSTTTLLGLPTCQKFDILRCIDAVQNACNVTNIIHEFSDVFHGLGCYPGEHHIVVDT